MGYSEAGNLEICKKAIEAKLNWGDSASWLNYDFEKLNEKIFAETNVQLSVSTLKRIFGKTSYRSSPSLTTLNTLARFIGFSDWREFTQSYVPAASSTEHWAISDTVSGQPVIRKFCRKYLMYCIIGAIVVIMGLIIGFTVQNRVYSSDYSKYAFKADKIVTEGVPNSVVFTYDATAAKPQDSVFIVQTWDITSQHLLNL